MKRLLLFLLLATSLLGQGQDSIRAVGGVLTINLVPSSTRYKVFVDQAITSTVFNNPVDQSIITLLFVQDAVGHTVAFGGNISGSCTISASANATTGCQFTFDAAHNAWTGISGGGSSSIGASTNVKSLGAFGDTKYAQGVTLSRVFSTVTLPAGSTATVGQFIQCGSPSVGVEVVPFPSANGGQTLPAKITAVAGQVVTYNTLPVGSGTDLTDGQCFFGHDDSAAITAAYNACKTASKAVQFSTFTQNYPCNVYLPSNGNGGYMITSTPFNETGSGGNTMGVGIIGDGENSSILYPMLGYTNSAPANCGFVICGFGWGQTYKDFAIELFASSFNTAGIAFANMHVAALNCGLCYVENVRISNWYNGGVNSLFMMEDTGGAEIHHVRLENPFGGATGGAAFQCNGCLSNMYYSFLSNTTQNLNVTTVTGRGSGSGFTDHGSVIDEGSISTITGAKSVAFFGTQLMGGANCLSVDATSEVRMSGGYCGTFNGNPGGGGPTVASGGKLWMADVEVSANGAGQYCYNSATLGGISDLGGNLCILAGGATTYKAGSANNQFPLTTQTQTQLGGQQVVNGAVPTGCTITGNGTSTCAFDTGSTDAAGRITITAAGTTTAVGLVSFSFATTYGTNSTNCSANYLSGTGTWAIGAIAPIFITNTTAGASFNINNAGTNLTATSTYKVNYTCYGQ